jgi:hypothetical protein
MVVLIQLNAELAMDYALASSRGTTVEMSTALRRTRLCLESSFTLLEAFSSSRFIAGPQLGAGIFESLIETFTKPPPLRRFGRRTV